MSDASAGDRSVERSVERTADRAAERTDQLLRLRSRIRGCLLGGALGDALGAPVEFLDLGNIRTRYGPRGLHGFVPAYGRFGAVTDDTQLTLFTAEGLIRAWVRGEARGICHPPSIVWHAYLRWLVTQGERWAEVGGRFYGESSREPDGWLVRERWLHARRAPGSTCLAALRSRRMGERRRPLNDSKGCGGVMRVAPAGLVDGPVGGDRFRGEIVDFAGIFELGCGLAAITHGHPAGSYPAGAMAVLVHALARGFPLAAALEEADRELRLHFDADETRRAFLAGRELAARGADVERLEGLGHGWLAADALAIAVYAALTHAGDLRAALIFAANHSGDSDSTASLCGQILGAFLGEEALPADWLGELEGRRTIEALADDLWRQVTGQAPPVGEAQPASGESALWLERYPGW